MNRKIVSPVDIYTQVCFFSQYMRVEKSSILTNVSLFAPLPPIFFTMTIELIIERYRWKFSPPESVDFALLYWREFRDNFRLRKNVKDLWQKLLPNVTTVCPGTFRFFPGLFF